MTQTLLDDVVNIRIRRACYVKQGPGGPSSVSSALSSPAIPIQCKYVRAQQPLADNSVQIHREQTFAIGTISPQEHHQAFPPPRRTSLVRQENSTHNTAFLVCTKTVRMMRHYPDSRENPTS